jgi:hypothetical protein
MINGKKESYRMKALIIAMIIFDILVIIYMHLISGGKFFDNNLDLIFKIIPVVGIACKAILLVNSAINIHCVRRIGKLYSPVLLSLAILNLLRLLYPPYISTSPEFPKYFGFHFELYMFSPLLTLYFISSILFFLIIPAKQTKQTGNP